jgi:hypothetical protein
MKNFVTHLLLVVLLTGSGHGGVRTTKPQMLPVDSGPAGGPSYDDFCAAYVPDNASIYIGPKTPTGVEAVRFISPTQREVNTNALLAAIEKVQAILETGEVSPYMVDGQELGLLITSLEVSSGQRYLELANGDVIQAINGQKVPNARKAIQILRKAQAQSSLDIQLQRGRDSNTLSFTRVAAELDGCFAFTYSSFSDWVALGRPACWCEPYQCDGDADGKTAGFLLSYRVYVGDLNLLLDNWKKKIDDPTLNPCADIDHKAETLQKYRVYTDDLAILLTAWKKKGAELAGDCPRLE